MRSFFGMSIVVVMKSTHSSCEIIASLSLSNGVLRTKFVILALSACTTSFRNSLPFRFPSSHHAPETSSSMQSFSWELPPPVLQIAGNAFFSTKASKPHKLTINYHFSWLGAAFVGLPEDVRNKYCTNLSSDNFGVSPF